MRKNKRAKNSRSKGAKNSRPKRANNSRSKRAKRLTIFDVLYPTYLILKLSNLYYECLICIAKSSYFWK